LLALLSLNNGVFAGVSVGLIELLLVSYSRFDDREDADDDFGDLAMFAEDGGVEEAVFVATDKLGELFI
jgi:hypothetical protein